MLFRHALLVRVTLVHLLQLDRCCRLIGIFSTLFDQHPDRFVNRYKRERFLTCGASLPCPPTLPQCLSEISGERRRVSRPRCFDHSFSTDKEFRTPSSHWQVSCTWTRVSLGSANRCTVSQSDGPEMVSWRMTQREKAHLGVVLALALEHMLHSIRKSQSPPYGTTSTDTGSHQMLESPNIFSTTLLAGRSQVFRMSRCRSIRTGSPTSVLSSSGRYKMVHLPTPAWTFEGRAHERKKLSRTFFRCSTS